MFDISSRGYVAILILHANLFLFVGILMNIRTQADLLLFAFCYILGFALILGCWILDFYPRI